MTRKHSIQWDNAAKTVVLQVYENGATERDMYEMANESAAMLNSVDHKVHLILVFPDRVFKVSLVHFKELESKVPPNQGALLIINADMYAKAMGRVAEKAAPKAVKDLHHLNSIEEAREYLVEHYGVTYP